MSLNQSVTESVNKAIDSFIDKISSKYDLDIDDLKNIWNGKSTTKTKSQEIPELDQDQLLKAKKPELQAMCRQRGVKSTGTKVQLIGYLLGKEVPTTTKKTPTPKKTKATPSIKPVIKNIQSSLPTITIRRNQFDNHEHPETSFIFNSKTRKVIGKQNDNGDIDDLTPGDIDMCNKWKFEYDLPSNLDGKDKLNDIKIDELEDEDDIVIEEEEDDIQELELVELDDDLEEEEVYEEEEEYEEDI